MRREEIKFTHLKNHQENSVIYKPEQKIDQKEEEKQSNDRLFLLNEMETILK